jgi:hypothetical protein
VSARDQGGGSGLSMRRVLWWALGALGAAIMLAMIAFLAWALTPLGPSEAALRSLESDEEVSVEDAPEGWVFRPTAAVVSAEATHGVVLYPGGRVDVRSYAPLARSIAERGCLVVLAPMPLSLAVLDADAAAAAFAAHPELESWTLGGHSLGGAMAAQFAAAEPEAADGLVLLAAYPAGSTDLSSAELAVATLIGTEDTVVDPVTFEQSLGRLPPDTRVEVLSGANHAQFGSYGPQPGDGVATMSPEEQLARSVDAFATVAGCPHAE